MPFSLLADFVVILHLAFAVFAVFGGLLCLWRRLVAWFHIPAALWAALVEFAGWICPLTPLENWLRFKAGGAGYSGSFVGEYILPVLYPAGLTRGIQMLMGILVVAVNLYVYYLVFIKRKIKQAKGRHHS